MKIENNAEQQVIEFYSKLNFPGSYTIDDIAYYDDLLCNKYLEILDKSISGARTVIDVGCGSGFITNFLARRHPGVEFDALDFSDSIDYARNFSTTHSINNISYIKENFLTWQPQKTYDVVICNGVLHHIPDQTAAFKKIKTLSSQRMVIGIYNRYGKLFKRFFSVDYVNQTLYLDQEKCPFETAFTDSEFRYKFSDYSVVDVYPSVRTHLVDLCSLINYKNGGLVVYVFE